MHTDITQATEHHKALGEILRRTSVPFLLFAAVLVVLLLLSWFLLLPNVTHIEVSGSLRSVTDLQAYKRHLSDQITGLEKKRNANLLPSQDSLYRKIIAMKDNRLRFQEVRQEVTHTARTFLAGSPDVISFRSLTYDAVNETAKIAGEVHDAGLQTMTIQAQFIDALSHIPFVRDIKSSHFTREKDDEGKYISPFTIQLFLNPE